MRARLGCATMQGILLMVAMRAGCDAALAESKKQFKILPGAAGSVEVALNTPPTADSVCSFSYSGVGATPEQWEIEVRGDAETATITCDVGRVGGQMSYLLFSKVELTIGLPIAEVSAFDNEERLLEDDQFVVDDTRVQNGPNWSGQLRGLSATSESPF